MWFCLVSPTVISTFAGCGGSSLGYKLAGYEELLAVEWDDNAVETFKLNFPGVPIYHGDIAKLSGSECMKLAGVKAGELDVLDGSPPCQGFSTAGKRKFDDPRNSLFKEFARLLFELQPRVFVMENVTGMVKGCMKQAYLTIIATLRDCGYRCKGEVLNAMYFNVPQSRERVIIIGVRNDLEVEPTHPKPTSKPIAADKAIQGADTSNVGNPRGIYVERMKRVRPGSNLARTENSNSMFSYVRCPVGRPCMTVQKSVTFQGFSVWHPFEERNLSVGELKRIASYPDTFLLSDSYEKAVARIGNSVPPNLMRAIAEHIKEKVLVSRETVTV